MDSNLIGRLWKNSFSYKTISQIEKRFINSLNNSFIISKLLNDKNIYGKDGILTRSIDKAKINLNKLLKWIRNIFSNGFTESYLVNIGRIMKKDISSDIYRFLFIVLGTSLFSYGILSFTKGIYSMKRILFFIILGILPIIIGFLNIDIAIIFMESKFIKLIKKIFDYNS